MHLGQVQMLPPFCKYTLRHQVQCHDNESLRSPSFVADVYSRVLWFCMLDPNTSFEEKQSILCEYNEYLPLLSLSLSLSLSHTHTYTHTYIHTQAHTKALLALKRLGPTVTNQGLLWPTIPYLSHTHSHTPHSQLIILLRESHLLSNKQQ